MTDTSAVTEELRKALAAEEGGRRWLRRGLIAGSIAFAIGAGLAYQAAHRPPPPARFVAATVATGDVVEKVQATGTVQPVLQVNVGAQVNGRVATVNVDFNSVVKKGDILAEIDPIQYGAQVRQQSANLNAQKATISQMEVNAETARIAYERTQRLVAQNLASKAELDQARGTYDAAQAQVLTAKAQAAAVAATLSKEQTNVSWTKIIAPVNGVVVTRSIDPGATVQASFQTPVLFVIAQDLRKMRVLADVDEADVGKLKEGMESDAVVDAFPGEIFQGKVQQIRYSPNNQSGVVTYSAVVEVNNPEEKLRPGMTATVTIRTRESKNVSRIPNAALRYKPTPPKGPGGKPLPQPPEPTLPKGQGRVFVLLNDKPGEEKEESRIIAIGATDGIYTEVTDPNLPVGTKIITDETDESAGPGKKKGPF
jgi:HlyD family secretion protein